MTKLELLAIFGITWKVVSVVVAYILIREWRKHVKNNRYL
jgi:hypothetical protein